MLLETRGTKVEASQYGNPATRRSQMYFKIGDLAVSIVVGALAAFLASKAFGPQWHPLVGMAGGMIVGMLAQFLIFLLLLPLLGAFEVMIPSMLASMLGSMVPSVQVFSPRALLLLGGVLGLIAYIWVELADWRLRGDRHVES